MKRANAIHFDVLFLCLPTVSAIVTGTRRFQSQPRCFMSIDDPCAGVNPLKCKTRFQDRSVRNDLYRILYSVMICQCFFFYACVVFTLSLGLGNRANRRTARSIWTGWTKPFWCHHRAPSDTHSRAQSVPSRVVTLEIVYWSYFRANINHQIFLQEIRRINENPSTGNLSTVIFYQVHC